MRILVFSRLSLSLIRNLFFSHHFHNQNGVRFFRSLSVYTIPVIKSRNCPGVSFATAKFSTLVEHISDEDEVNSGFLSTRDKEPVKIYDGASEDLKTPILVVKELDELPEQWRRSKLAWLCKELPAYNCGTLFRILNEQRKWMRQEDTTYVIVHCTRIRENEAGFKVYKWMMQQIWYRFDFALSTKLADFMGKERKLAKCREIFDDIINQGRVPSESTFHTLVVAYLSVTVQGSFDEACSIYNRMIQLGDYKPRPSLHNSLFRALVNMRGVAAKHYLKQAEFIYHNLVVCGMEIHKDIYSGLIWLHSHQDSIDKERIASLREEMLQDRLSEGTDILVSVLRACAKEGSVEEAEKVWLKLLETDDDLPMQAFIFKMEVYAKIGKSMKSLEIFREMQEHFGFASVVAYHKIIKILCKAQEVELSESLMQEFINTGMKPLVPSFADLLDVYLNLSLHDKLESMFSKCAETCRPNSVIYNIYLDSLVKLGNLDKAEEIFNHMCSEVLTVNSKSCNVILSGFLSSGDYVKAEKIYDLMCKKKYDIESPLMEKLDYVLSLSRKEVRKPVSMKLSKEQREILVGLLLGGLRIDSDDQRKNHMMRFEFGENSQIHSVLKSHLHEEFEDWLHPSCKSSDETDNIPDRFSTISHSYFGFYADQFYPQGQFHLPKLIHRWLSPRTLAYWFMYGGHTTSSGDILLKLTGNREGVEKVVKSLRTKSMNCRVKKKGGVFWLGFLGSDSAWFWKLTEPFILEELKEFLKAGDQSFDIASIGIGDQNISFDSGSDSEDSSDHDSV